MEIKVIAHIRTEFPEKFGIPRQSGLAATHGTVVFSPEYRNPDALRGLEGFSHVWLLWEFSKAVREDWSPTVRPPRLGGNTRMGVFATRSPFRPNPVGLSAVKLTAIRRDPQHGMVLDVEGADLMDGTPIFDIKPYLPFADSHPEATGGFADPVREDHLTVKLPESIAAVFAPAEQETLRQILAQDPRPSYQDDPARVYSMAFAGHTVRFCVEGDTLTVCEIE